MTRLIAVYLPTSAAISEADEPTKFENVTLFEDFRVTTFRDSQIEVKIRNASFFSASMDIDRGDAKTKLLHSASVRVGGSQIVFDVSENPSAERELIKHSGFHRADVRLP